jgi:hypothetical protein
MREFFNAAAIVVAIMLLGVSAHAFFANHGMMVSGGKPPPAAPTPTAISPLSTSVQDNTGSGVTLVTTFTVTMSDASTFTGTITDQDTTYTQMSGNSLVTKRAYVAGDDGAHSFTLTACQAGKCLSPQTFTLTINAAGSVPAAAASAGFTNHIFHADFTDSYYGTMSNWIMGCGASPTAPGPKSDGHVYMWPSWAGIGQSYGNSCDGSHISQVSDGGQLGLQMRFNPSETGTRGGGLAGPGVVLESAGTNPDASSDCNVNGATCFNFFYAEIVARVVQYTGGASNPQFDFWRGGFGGSPEIDGFESSSNGTGHLGDLLHGQQGLNASAGLMENLYSINTTQYFKFAFRYQSTGHFNGGGCQNGGDFADASISVYAGQNLSADPPGAQNGTNVCLSSGEIAGTAPISGPGHPAGISPIQIIYQTGDTSVNGQPDGIFIVRSIDVWSCPSWVAGQTPTNCFSSTFQGSP